MWRKAALGMLFAVVLCLFVLPQYAYASFEADTGALCIDSTYFKDRGFDSASSLLASAKDITSDSFVLVFYSRYDSSSRELLPQIKQWAESNHFMIYGIDHYNKYTPEYGYFNTKIAFEGWEEYLDRQNFSFPAVFIYNSDTRQLTAQDDINNFNIFYNLLYSSGMLEDAYHDYARAGTSSTLLGKLGLMQGTGSGFDLLRAPNRAEALTMLIRLLGKEDEALLCSLPHPFADVPQWASPYVGYAYYYGITQGVSDTEFGSYAAVSANEYLTFVLRALGYDSGEGGDFSWDSPYALACSVGILPSGVNTSEFLRADMAIVSAAAVSCRLKNSTDTLAHRLVAQRSVTSGQLLEFMGLEIETVSARQQMADTLWQSLTTVRQHSPEFVAESIEAAAYRHSTYIALMNPAGSVFDWAAYLAQNLSFPSGAVSSYRLQITNKLILITPEYTAAAGIYAALTVEGYESETSHAIAAEFIKQNLPAILEKGAEKFCDEYFAGVQIIEDPTGEYSGADAALLLRYCTEEAVSSARWLIAEVERTADWVK